MRIDPEDLRKQYRALSDGELEAIDRDDLVEVAQRVFDEEVARRRSLRTADNEEDEAGGDAAGTAYVPAIMEGDGEPRPEWLDDASCACSFVVRHGAPENSGVPDACAALAAAGIPCYVAVRPAQDGGSGAEEYSLMVPGALNLHATSVLDRDVFNPQAEEDWRTHFGELSDEQLRALDPEVFCAGLLDRAARLRNAYEEEIARRGLKARGPRAGR